MDYTQLHGLFTFIWGPGGASARQGLTSRPPRRLAALSNRLDHGNDCFARMMKCVQTEVSSNARDIGVFRKCVFVVVSVYDRVNGCEKSSFFVIQHELKMPRRGRKPLFEV